MLKLYITANNERMGNAIRFSISTFSSIITYLIGSDTLSKCGMQCDYRFSGIRILNHVFIAKLEFTYRGNQRHSA